MSLSNKWKKFLKEYSFLSIIANLFVAVSISGLSVLGVLSPDIAFPTLLTSAVILGVIGLLGRFVDETYDDLEGRK